jgi:LysR family glycine cleavage system transcriptional activator
VPDAQQLEGFPLLHVDLYRNDPEAPDWASWIAENGLSRSSPERGMRFQRVGAAADAVLADAGLALCGLALLREPLDAGRIVLPFPFATGRWTAHAFQARYRAETLVRPQLRRFRAWVAEEARLTAAWLEALTAPIRHNR